MTDGARAEAAGAASPEATSAEVAQLIVETSALLRGAQESRKILIAWLRATHRLLGAEASCVVTRFPGDPTVRVRASQPREAEWDLRLLGALAGAEDAPIPLGYLGARIERRGRAWGAIVARRPGGTFSTSQRHALQRIAAEISERISRLDRERLAEVRARIDFKILRDLSPKDLYYQILDGLNLLTRYDHSASLFILEPGSERLEIVAEQVAWQKMKSPNIGVLRPVDESLVRMLDGGAVFGFDFFDGAWREWTSQGAAALASALDPVAFANDAARGVPRDVAPPMGAMLCAALGARETGYAVLRLGAIHPGTFGNHELEIVRGFVPAVAVALERSRAGERVRRQVLAAERHAVFAHLARGVAHDVNNALGAVLPLVQQIQADLEEQRLDPATLKEDLREIENSLEVCRRIFAGMLRWARGSATHGGSCDAARAVRNAVEVLDGMMRRSGVKLALDLADGLPPARGSQAEMEQLFLNLATNAIEAMPRGGHLTIAMRLEDDRIRAEVEDTGRGIEPGEIARVEEPFVTTKENGTGLGLPTCRSILSGIGGEMRLASEPGRGTRVTVELRCEAESGARA
jgi:signal transduction histidine kinase